MAIFNVGGVLWVALMVVMMSGVNGGVLFTSLVDSLVVSAQLELLNNHAGEPQAGEDHIAVHWSLNSSFAGQDSKYSKIVTHLCFAPVSQVNRAWRKTKPDLSLDKTCSGATIATQHYTSAGNSTAWLIGKEVPKATYFVRAYAMDANGMQLAYGQTTNKNKTTNLFTISPISGRNSHLDIASAVFSVFAVAALFGYLGLESLLARRKQRYSDGK